MQNMKSIKPLQQGDTILLISPAKAIPLNLVEMAVKEFESWGLTVEVGPNTSGQHHYFSGTDLNRANDLQWALDHPTAKAIISARGGYGSIRIVDEVNFDTFILKPKWFVGFSDITVFHNKLHGTYNLPSIHAVAPLYFDKLSATDEAMVTLKKALFDDVMSTTIESHKCNRVGKCSGLLVGGNLAIVASLIGTSIDIDTSGKILFLEEVSEYAYRFDRMLWSLKKSGKLENLQGLVLGGLTDMKACQETFGCSIEELIQDVTREYDFPVMFNYPAGHQLDNRALIFGKEYILEVSEKEATLKLQDHGQA